jgi:hypothetical protein
MPEPDRSAGLVTDLIFSSGAGNFHMEANAVYQALAAAKFIFPLFGGRFVYFEHGCQGCIFPHRFDPL